MKTAMLISFTLVLGQAAALSQSGHSLSLANPAPAPAPAPGPAGAGLPVLRLSFEIQNFNYYDLTKADCPKEAEPKKKKVKKVKKDESEVEELEADVEEGVEDVEKGVDDVERDVGIHDGVAKMEKQVAEHMDAGAKPSKLPWVKEESLLEADVSSSGACPTYRDTFSSAIEGVVRDLIESVSKQLFPSAASAPAIASVASAPAQLVPLPPQPKTAFLQAAPSPAPGPAPAPPAKQAIFVTFKPGQDIKGVQWLAKKSIIVEVTFTDTPNNGLDDLALMKTLIQHAIDDGSFRLHVKEVLHNSDFYDIKPKLGKVTLQDAVIEQWDVKKCTGHIQGIVNQFSKTYTKEQVPMALYNECNTFMTKISFSHDHVLDHLDTKICKRTVAKFAKHWNFGEKTEDDDFKTMCLYACEAKFGNKAPQCNVNVGDGLLGQPL